MIKTKTYKNLQGEKIFTEVYTPKKAKSTVVFLHGITGCRKGRTPADNYLQTLAGKLMEQNYKVVLFDFSGHGDSEGNDFDVTLSKSLQELETIFAGEVADETSVNFWAFSYGATVLTNFLKKHKNVKPKAMVLFSPCLYPIKSCFLSANSIFGKDIVRAKVSGELKKAGYALVGAKGFKFGQNILAECKTFKPNYLKNFGKQTLVLTGSNDVIMNTEYNKAFCKKYKIENTTLNASHSLFEAIDNASKLTIEHFNKFN